MARALAEEARELVRSARALLAEWSEEGVEGPLARRPEPALPARTAQAPVPEAAPPPTISGWLGVFATMLPRRQAESIREELETHLRDRVRDLMVGGLNESESTKRAIAELGEAAELAGKYRALANEPEPMTVHERSVKSIDAQALWQAVRRLSAHDQEVIYLRYFLDMPELEMATTLNVAQGTIKSRLSRALGRLRDVVQREFPGLKEEFDA